MLKTFLQLLGEDAPVFRRYAWMAVAHGLLCGLTITALAPLLSRLLAGDLGGAARWLAVLLAGVIACWAWRRRVEQAGVRVGTTVLQTARHRLGDHVASLPVGWFTPQNTARLSHIVTQGTMAVAQLPAHVFTPVIGGLVTPFVIVGALFALHWQLGLIALAALPLLAGVLFLTGRLARRADGAFHERYAGASQRMVEFSQAQSVLRAFNGEGGGMRFLEQAVDRQRQSATRLIFLSSLAAVLNVWAIQAVFAALLVAAAVWLNGSLGGALATPDVIGAIVALLLVGRYIDPLLEVAGYGDARAARADSSTRSANCSPSSRCPRRTRPRRRATPPSSCAACISATRPTRPRCCAASICASRRAA